MAVYVVDTGHKAAFNRRRLNNLVQHPVDYLISKHSERTILNELEV